MTHDKKNHTQNAARGSAGRQSKQPQQPLWRGLEELADTPEFRERLENEFPQGAAQWNDPIGRRKFLKLMGASMALAGLVGCTRQPDEAILPYTNRPEGMIIGESLYYATAMPLAGYATGLLVESIGHRPVKVEGNPDHPASMGGTDAFAQASTLSFYDPDRSASITDQGEPTGWQAFVDAIQARLAESGNGQGVHLLTETITSPTMVSQLEAFQQAYPDAVWHQYDPISRDNMRAGAQLAFGEVVEPVYDLSQASIILSLDSNMLASGPGNLRYARDFALGRRVWETDEMNRLYAIESTFTETGAVADHRLPVKSSAIEAYARLIASQLGLDVETTSLELSEEQQTWIDGLVADLQDNQGASLVVAGDEQPPAVHALAYAINDALGNTGSTVSFVDPVAASSTDGAQLQAESLQMLVDAMSAGEVETLIIMSANPVFTAPADLAFADALANVPLSVHLGVYNDETGVACSWHVPEAHSLEAWSDVRAYDGTATIIQPLIAPLYNGKTMHELMAVLNDSAELASYDIVRNYWQQQNGGDDFEMFWQLSLSNGIVENTAFELRTPTASTGDLPAPQPVSEGMELSFRPDPSVWDGRFANNGWLQEVPRPLTLLVWDNAALISARTAISMLGIGGVDINNLTPDDYDKLDGANGSLINIEHNGRSLQMPVWILPGQPDDTITVHLGYGHTGLGETGNGVGFDVYQLRTSEAPWFGPASASAAGGTYQLVTTQTHHSMEGRAIMRQGTLEQYREEPGFIGTLAEFPNHPDRSLFQDLFPYEGNYSWGMVMDLNSFVVGNAAVIACQAENNIPIVGKDECAIGREMQWLRIDRYYGGDMSNPVLYQQPMACVHCELAPCEIVCPVNATVHNHEGLNMMIYNRCVGTKYCSNNCPYKVRRFNFFSYTEYIDESSTLQLMQNPDVTVRSRGVMEKCTYCVQRIQKATIQAKNEGRDLEDGEVIPACAQALSTRAFTFGDLNNEDSQVYELKQNLLNYGVLEELNFFPRTTYLGRIANPNPAIGMREGTEYPGHGVPFGSPHGEEDSHGGGESH